MKHGSMVIALAMVALQTLLVNTLAGETHVSGGLFSDENWTSENSPYVVDSDVVVFPNVTLTIEPGVAVAFNDSTSIEVRGALYAVGFETDSISFTSSSDSPVKGIWYGIKIISSLGGSAIIKYSCFSYAAAAVEMEVSSEEIGPFNIYNSRFSNNIIALQGYTGWKTVVGECLFENDSIAITGSNKEIFNCIFRDNAYGIYRGSGINVSNSTFSGHTEAALSGNGSKVINCRILNNKVGILNEYNGFLVVNSTISGNDIGVILSEYGNISEPLKDNNIYDNLTYNVQNKAQANVQVANNWWGTTDPAEIEAKLFDAKDSLDLGLLIYEPYFTEPVSEVEHEISIKFMIPGGSGDYAPAIGTDGTIYYVSNEKLSAINMDGIPIWEYTVGQSQYNCPVLSRDGTIYIKYIYDFPSALHAINPDGTLKWKYEVGENGWFDAPALGNEGILYLGDEEGYLHAINTDGSQKWKFFFDEYFATPPSIGPDGTIYIGTTDNSLAAVNPDGTLKWSIPGKDSLRISYDAAPVIGGEGTIYMGFNVPGPYGDIESSYLYAINPDSTLKWRYFVESGGVQYLNPVIGAEGIIYMATENGYLYALNPEGEKEWSYRVCDFIFGTPAVSSDGTIYLEGDSTFYAVNSGGTLKWKYVFSTSGLLLSSSPTIGRDGTLYISTWNYFYAFDSGTNAGLADSPWPKYGCDLRNSGNISYRTGEPEPSGPVCDFTGDGKILINDVIAYLLYARDYPDDLAKLDWNGDGKYLINDAITFLLHIQQGTCPDAGAVLAAAGKGLPLASMEKLTPEDISYIEHMMAQMNLTPEQEAAFRLALYGEAGTSSLPRVFSLSQNSPNPFNPSTTISYEVPERAPVQVTVRVYNLRGQLVRTLVEDVREAGTYTVFWDGTDTNGRQVSSGVYLYRMRAGDFVQTRKMVLLK